MRDIEKLMETFMNLLSSVVSPCEVYYEVLPEGAALPAVVYDVVDGPEATLTDTLIFIVKVFSLDKVETLKIGNSVIGERLHCYSGVDSVTGCRIAACSVFASHSAPKEADTDFECRIEEIRVTFRR